MSRLFYHREWAKKHTGYKAAHSRRRALIRGIYSNLPLARFVRHSQGTSPCHHSSGRFAPPETSASRAFQRT